MSKAKAIGTRAETAVRNYLLSAGYDELEAHRNVLSGSQDQGDVWLREPTRGLIVFELKGGNAAKNASYEQCLKWFKETEKEKKHAGANFGFLVTQRAGVGYPRAGQWWAYAALGDLLTLRCGVRIDDSTFVRITLEDLVGLFNG
tara:strand:- start:430 stop:864 length:435 start_codon:yes stop_codon:yes gene_type:complete